MSVCLRCHLGGIVEIRGFRLNDRQRLKLYDEMLDLYIEVCAKCNATKKEKGVDKFKIHHTRYDVNPLDPRYTRFLCNGCQQDPDLTVEKIWKENQRNPLPDLPSKNDPATPRTFQKGEIIQKRLSEYLPRRLMEESERTFSPDPKLLYEDFRADACSYCNCLPRAMDQHMEVLVAKSEGLYMFYESPKDQSLWIKWRE